jgi:hypothetical protein
MQQGCGRVLELLFNAVLDMVFDKEKHESAGQGKS